jgi:hypothetical protein
LICIIFSVTLPVALWLMVANSQCDAILRRRAACGHWHGRTVCSMRELLILAIHLLVSFAKLVRPGGVRAIPAESLLLKHQLLIANRLRRGAPNLTSSDRFVFALTTLFVNSRRIPEAGAFVKPVRLFKFHQALSL